MDIPMFLLAGLCLNSLSSFAPCEQTARLLLDSPPEEPSALSYVRAKMPL
jgi:hypothetical protein